MSVFYVVTLDANGNRSDVARSPTKEDAEKHRDELLATATASVLEIEERDEPHDPAWTAKPNP